jgi:predicted kinase
MICGQQGAGKTTLALTLARELPAVRFSLDEWIVDLFGKTMPEPMTGGWWIEHAERCAAVLWPTARQALAAGTDVVLDYGFPTRAHRAQYFQLAGDAGARTKLYVVTADGRVRRKRVLARNRKRPETFALLVTEAMFDGFPFEPLGRDEVRGAVKIVT